MSSQTRTRNASETATSTLTKVVYVTRKVQADLFNIVDTYNQITQDYAEKLIHDLRILLDEEVLDRIELIWTFRNTSIVLGAYAYKVIGNGIGLADDRAGGIRYDSVLQSCDFGVRIFRNVHWSQMSPESKHAISGQCKLTWSSAGALDYSHGTFTSARMYSKDSLGLDRQNFARN